MRTRCKRLFGQTEVYQAMNAITAEAGTMRRGFKTAL
jgi:hypothetical protein